MTRAVRQRSAAEGDERGSVSVFVLGLVVSLMVVAGLVVDGGRAVNARSAIMDDAEQAARAGANQVDLASLRAGEAVSLDAAAARTAAVEHLVALGYDAADITVGADQAEVHVEVDDSVPTALLSLIFIRSFDVHGAATARAAPGVTSEITGAP